MSICGSGDEVRQVHLNSEVHREWKTDQPLLQKVIQEQQPWEEPTVTGGNMKEASLRWGMACRPLNRVPGGTVKIFGQTVEWDFGPGNRQLGAALSREAVIVSSAQGRQGCEAQEQTWLQDFRENYSKQSSWW